MPSGNIKTVLTGSKGLRAWLVRKLQENCFLCLGIPSNLLLASMRDRASVNNVAMCTISIVYTNGLMWGAYTTIDHVGSKFIIPTLISTWIGLFSHSP